MGLQGARGEAGSQSCTCGPQALNSEPSERQDQGRREGQGDLDALNRLPARPGPEIHYLGGPVIAEVEDAHRRKPRVAELLVVSGFFGLKSFIRTFTLTGHSSTLY